MGMALGASFTAAIAVAATPVAAITPPPILSEKFNMNLEVLFDQAARFGCVGSDAGHFELVQTSILHQRCLLQLSQMLFAFAILSACPSRRSALISSETASILRIISFVLAWL